MTEELANFLINERGYLVIGLESGKYQVGQHIKKLWNRPVEQPFTVIAITDRADWKEQIRLASANFTSEFKKEWMASNTVGGGYGPSKSYYRVVTD